MLSKPSLSLVALPLAFAVLGTCSRWIFQLTHTRLQISIFVALAALIEIFADDFGYRSNWTRFVLCAVAATCAIVAVRFHLEGLPRRLTEWMAARGR